MNRSTRPRPLRLLASLIAVQLTGAACASSPGLAPCPSPNLGRVHVPASIELPKGDAAAGASLFETECAKCHEPQQAARSRLRAGYPRLDCADFLGSVSDAYLAHVIGEGGESVGLAATMQPFAGRLSASQMADLIAFIRQAERSN